LRRSILPKIDAEGVDFDVLKGMNIIVEWTPPLLAETGKDPFEIIQLLKDAGLSRISVIDEKKQKTVPVGGRRRSGSRRKTSA